MDDLINRDTNYVIQDKEGTKWYFYLSENKKIMYTTNRQGDWSTHEYIDSQPIKSYSATIDSKGVIRMVAYTMTRQLLYFELVDEKWTSQVIERIYSRFQDIPYFSIYSSALGVHILCYINHSLSRSGEMLIHYYLHEGTWHGGKLWKFMSDHMTTFQSVCIDDNNRLHMLFTQKWRQRIHLYYCVYDPSTLSWIEPIAIHSSSSPHSYEIYVDSSENIHIFWSRDVEQQHQIRHLLKLANDVQGGWKESVIHESSHRIKVPLMIEDGDLYCIWKEGKSIYRMYSRDLGQNWSAPELLRDSLDYDAMLFNFIYLDNEVPKSLDVWGQGYPNIKLEGVTGHLFSSKKQTSEEINPQLSSYSQETEQKDSADWTNIKRAIVSLRRENKGLNEGINNLFSQIQHLNSIIYSLQDQMQMNERSLFNINAQIKQLNFQIKQLQLRSRQSSPKIYHMQNGKYQPLPVTLNEEGKIIVDRPAKREVKLESQGYESLKRQGKQALDQQRQKESDTREELDVQQELGTQGGIDERKEPVIQDESNGRKEPSAQEKSNVSQQPEAQEKLDEQQEPDAQDAQKEMKMQEEPAGQQKLDMQHQQVSKEQGLVEGRNQILEENREDIKDIGDIEDVHDVHDVDDMEDVQDVHDVDDIKSQENKDTQRISLGNTIILINPENSDDY